jgi:hypothetical protein
MTNTNTATDQAFTNLANGLMDCIANMVTAREEYAAAKGFTATDEEIVESVKASLLRMLAA